MDTLCYFAKQRVTGNENSRVTACDEVLLDSALLRAAAILSSLGAALPDLHLPDARCTIVNSLKICERGVAFSGGIVYNRIITITKRKPFSYD